MIGRGDPASISRRALLGGGVALLGGCARFHDSDLLPVPDQRLDDADLAHLPFPVRRLDVTASGRRIAAYHAAAPAGHGVMVAFGGNGNSVLLMLKVVAPKAHAIGLGLVVASYDVQGEASPTVPSLLAAARAVYDAASGLGAKDTYLLGHSLGCWIAITLANEVPARVLVLAAVGTTVARTFAQQYAPLDWVVDYRSDPDVAALDAIAAARAVEMPTLIFTSHADTAIPPYLTRQVFQALPTATRRRLVVFDDVPHGSYLARPAFWSATRDFIVAAKG